MNKPDLPKITRIRKPFVSWAALVVGTVAALLVFELTPPPGPGLDPDSAAYLGAAEALARGHGFRVPIAEWRATDSASTLSHFPPGYSSAIALPTALGMKSVQAARLINAVAAFIDIALVVWLVGRIAVTVAGVAAAAALLVMPALVEVHLSVLSEPLYLACTTCALASMLRLAESKGKRDRLLWSCAGGIAAAAAVLVRYVGISVVAAVAVWVIAQPGMRAERLRRGVYALSPTLLLLGGWMTYVHLTSGVGAIRTLGAYPGILETLRTAVSTFVAWLVPLESDDVLPGRPMIALVLLAATVWIVRRGARSAATLARPPATSTSEQLALIVAASMLAVSYVLVLVAARLLADPGIPFDERLLSPLFLLVTIIIAVAASVAWRDSRRTLRVLGAVVFLSWWLASYRATSDEVSYTLENGHDLTEIQWRTSPLLAWARANAPRRPLYSNWPSAVYLQLGRASHELPEQDDAATLHEFVDTLRARNGIVVAFDWQSPDQIGVEALRKAIGLHLIARFADGSVFAANP